jgi:hypothetical protein
MNKHKHLEFIQAAINRMAGNLFLLKGWTITLIAALFDLYFLIAYIPALMFWALDGFFLSQERRFRALYDDVRQRTESQIDFSMSTEPYKKKHTWLGGVFSRTLNIYYGVLIGTMAIIMVLIRWA